MINEQEQVKKERKETNTQVPPTETLRKNLTNPN